MDDSILRNREHWGPEAADWYEQPGAENWQSEPRWGVFGIPEADLGVLPPDLEGKEVLEAGCGTGYLSAWMARRGAQPIGLDNSPHQLASAARFQDRFGQSFPLVWGVAEALPFADASFDVVISEYGAALWSDPHAWIPEAGRVLRPGGELILMTNSAMMVLCVDEDEAAPVSTTLKRPYFGMHRFEWPDQVGVEFHLTHGDWVRLLRRTGFEVTDLIEVQVPPGAESRYPWADAAWGGRWPIEEVWKARKVSEG